MDGDCEISKLSREPSTENLPVLEESSDDQQFLCQICNEKFKEPRVLQCLHVFCTSCLEKLIESTNDEAPSIGCPTCSQVTRLGRGILDIPLDVVTVNMMEMAAIRTLQVLCTSCKASEKAVARCSDCSNFLCPSCVTAHDYMKCFDTHRVESFDELKQEDGRGIHKPIYCTLHPLESLKYFCSTCQMLICSECMMCIHKLPDHKCDRVSDLETKQIEDLKVLMEDTKSKIDTCRDTSGSLESLLSDLQQQRDAAQDLIKETFQSYKAILEKRKDEMIEQLEKIHCDNELAVMEMFHNVEKTVDKIEDACKFTERVVKHANGVEVLTLKKLINMQLLTLLNNIPRGDLNIKIEFVSDSNKFTSAVNEHFGRINKPTDAPHNASQFPIQIQMEVSNNLMHHSMESDRFNPGSISPDDIPGFMPSLSNLTPPSLPDLTANIVTSLSNLSVHPNLSNLAPSLHNLPYVERSLSRNSYSPSMSDSGISVDAASASNNHSMLNLQALIKLGTVALNAQGQITVNGQVVPGLNWNAATGGLSQTSPSQALPTRPHVSMPSTSDAALAGLLNSVSLSSTPLPPSTPQMNDLSALFNSLSPNQAINLGGIRSSSPITAVVAAANLLSGPPPNMPMNGNFQASTSNPFNGTGPGSLRARNSGKINAMEIRTKFGQLGPGKGQFNSPHGFCLGMDEDIVVADTNNHRIQVFEKTGEFKYQFGIPGREEGQLWYPRKVAVIRTTGKYVVCDRGSERSRMQLFTRTGQFIKKIAIRYIDIVAGLAITGQGHIVAVDSVSPTVFCISESGDLIKWFDCSDYMREPSDIAVSGKDYYVCDFKGHCVVVFNEDGQFLHRIGCENITNYPNGIDISDAGDVLIGDSHGNRFHVAVFQREGSLIGEFECPYVKVSRCCGLKITSEGYIVTLAKNNQHVLVLNTLYIA